MNRLLEQLRNITKRIFFWHEGASSSREFHPPHADDRSLVVKTRGARKIPTLRQLRYATELLKRPERRLLLGAMLVLGFGLTLGAYGVSREHLVRVPTSGGSVIEAVVGTPKFINPLYAPANGPDADLVALIYSGLFKRVDGNIVPDLAERFEWSDEGRRLRIELRQDVRFHDTTLLTSDDVIFTLRAAQNPNWRSTYVKTFENMLMERIDDYTLNINLRDPDAEILDALTIGILPAHIWSDVQPGNALLADGNIHPIGTGPFQVRSLRHDSLGSILAYTLERSPNYYGITPFLDRLELRFFPDRIQAEEALRGGQVDTLAFVPNDAVGSLTKNERIGFLSLELPQETIAFLNVKDDVLKNINVRQALELATDREAIVAAQANIARAVFGPFPFMEMEPQSSSTEERLEEARKLLNSAGWVRADGSDVRILKSTAKNASTTIFEAIASSTPLELTLDVPEVPDLIAVAESLKRQWSVIGIRINIRTEAPDALLKRVRDERNAQIVLWNVLLNPSQDVTPVWLSTAAEHGLNLSNLADRTVDDALDSLRTVTSTESVNVVRMEITAAIKARAPAVFLTRPAYGYIYQHDIHGTAESLKLGTPSDRFQDIPNWYVKSSWRWK